MKFNDAVDAYIADQWAQGWFTSPKTEVSYRACLDRHAEDCDNRDPRYSTRELVKHTLRRWKNPNTLRVKRTILIKFYDWYMEEGVKAHNPARQTSRVKRRPVNVYRLTQEETWAMLKAARGSRERRVIFLGLCAGLRRGEILGLQGRHLERDGWVWVSEDIAKGGRERSVRVISDLAPVVAEIRGDVAHDEYVVPAQRFRDPGVNKEREDRRKHPASPQAIYYLVQRVGKRAGIAAPIHPHLLRHAFADHIAKHAGVHVAQHQLGHATLGTTEAYLSKPTLDAIAAQLDGISLSQPRKRPAKPVEATTGIEPVQRSSRVPMRNRRGSGGRRGHHRRLPFMGRKILMEVCL